MKGARVPRSFLDGFVMILLLIPIAIFLAIKWIIKGIIILIVTIKNN